MSKIPLIISQDETISSTYYFFLIFVTSPPFLIEREPGRVTDNFTENVVTPAFFSFNFLISAFRVFHHFHFFICSVCLYPFVEFFGKIVDFTDGTY